MDEAPPGAISVTETTSTTTTTTTTKLMYYVVQTSGKCMPFDDQTPSWMKESDFHDNYTECCKKSWNTEPCLAYGLSLGLSTLSPTSRPTAGPTADPTIKPTNHPSLNPTSTHPTSANPTRNPTTSPSVPMLASVSNSLESSENPCEPSLWHPSEDYSTCTNR